MKMIVITGIIAVAAMSGAVAMGNHVNAARAARQQEIDVFAMRHLCEPADYVAGPHGPIRTYKCNNGVFIADDMKEPKE